MSWNRRDKKGRRLATFYINEVYLEAINSLEKNKSEYVERLIGQDLEARKAKDLGILIDEAKEEESLVRSKRLRLESLKTQLDTEIAQANAQWLSLFEAFKSSTLEERKDVFGARIGLEGFGDFDLDTVEKMFQDYLKTEGTKC